MFFGILAGKMYLCTLKRYKKTIAGVAKESCMVI